MPADTDYRRYATVAGGVDLAWFEHGALYHTPRDSLEDEYFVGKEGSLQAMGENAIYLLYQLAQMKSFESKESAVFFDILGISVSFVFVFFFFCRPNQNKNQKNNKKYKIKIKI